MGSDVVVGGRVDLGVECGGRGGSGVDTRYNCLCKRQIEKAKERRLELNWEK